VTGEWRKLHNVELHNFYSSPNISRIILSRGDGGVRHAYRTKEMRNAYKIPVRKQQTHHLRDLYVNGRILKLILEK
jgi:hypothetical protein